MAVVLNSDKNGICQRSWLKHDERTIQGNFKRLNLEPYVCDLRLVESLSENITSEYRAESFFYGQFEFPRCRIRKKVGTKVQFTSTDTFLAWSLDRLHEPRDVEACKFGVRGSLEPGWQRIGTRGSTFVESCASNYLLKNFWHNFVHCEIQGITHSNYSEFGGNARHDSDFEADNLGTIFLVYSYGIPIRANGNISAEIGKKIGGIFARNRCNLVFAERAAHRTEDNENMSDEERWNEYVWRFRRGVSGAISNKLVQNGLAVRSLSVNLTGQRKRRDANRNWWYVDGDVVVELNGRRINSGLPPYLPDDELDSEKSGIPIAAARRRKINALKAQRRVDIADAVVSRYRAVIRDDGLRKYANSSLQAVFDRFGLKFG